MPKLREEVSENQVYTRGFIGGVEVRAINEEKRTAEFVAATENGVDTWGGKEYLRMGGAKLTRFRKNPVVLDTHDRYSVGSVIGKADVKVEGKALIATVTFAATTRAEEVWSLVKGGFIRALSVGFIPYSGTIKRLAEGEVDGEGEDAVTGPARIIKSWELFEISVVPVPADADALRRSFDDFSKETIAAIAAALGIKPQNGNERSLQMENEKEKQPGAAPAGAETKPAEAPDPQARALALQRETAATIRAIAPKGHESLADKLIVEGVSVEDARKRFLTALGEETKPVGTPEPKAPEKPEAKAEESKRAINDLTADSLLG